VDQVDQCHYNDQCEDDFGTKFIHFFMASSLILLSILEIKMIRQDDIFSPFYQSNVPIG